MYVTVNFAANLPYEDEQTQRITWTTDPKVTGSEPCKKRGVLSMIPPDWADTAEIALTFAEEGRGWMFNFGDSPHNNGFGEFFSIGKLLRNVIDFKWLFVIGDSEKSLPD